MSGREAADELLVLVRLDGVQGAAEPALEEHQVVVPVFEDLVLDEQVTQVRDGLRGRVAGPRASGLGRCAPVG